jgi:hypothetical protein
MSRLAAFVSLTAARLLPSRVRATRNRERIAFLIDDLNGAYFTLVARKSTTDRRQAALARVRRILRGCVWMTGAEEHAWVYVQDRVEESSDAFGPAAVLLTVARNNTRVHRWVSTLATDVRRALYVSLGAEHPSLTLRSERPCP